MKELHRSPGEAVKIYPITFFSKAKNLKIINHEKSKSRFQNNQNH